MLVHDGARPYVTKEILLDCIENVKKYGSGVAACRATDTVARAENGNITQVYGKENVYMLQTPQGFYREELLQAYENASGEYPDESSVFAAAGKTPHLSKGSLQNRKLTFKEDFSVPFRTGNGYDTHRLETGRDLILCGIKIPFEKGLLGHSDADAPLHALMEAFTSPTPTKLTKAQTASNFCAKRSVSSKSKVTNPKTSALPYLHSARSLLPT